MSSRESMASEFLDAAMLSSLPELELQAKFLVSGFLSGLHRSPMKGGSAEFKEFRAYQQGDELKSIDWKVFARTDKLHVRLHEEDTDMSCYIVLDRSASMDYKSPKGSMTKWNYGRAIAAALVYFLHRQRDNISLSYIGEGLEDYRKAASRASHMHSLMAGLHRKAAAQASDIAGALETLVSLVRRRSIVMVISDFYADPAAIDSAAVKIKHLNSEVIFMHVLDPRELSFDFDEPIILRELEGAANMPVSPDAIRDDYRRKIEAHVTAIEAIAHSLGGDYVLLKTDEVPLKALGSYLHRRELML